MAQKYIVGDVVMYDNKIMVVKEPRDGSHFDLSCPKEGLVYCFVDIEEIKSVRLTPEILEKNGWREEKGDYINDNYHIKLCEKIDGYSAYKVVNDTIVWLRDVKSVSNLQHLIFGLGLNSEMEVYV
jgi:hypothetical protein